MSALNSSGTATLQAISHWRQPVQAEWFTKGELRLTVISNRPLPVRLIFSTSE